MRRTRWLWRRCGCPCFFDVFLVLTLTHFCDFAFRFPFPFALRLRLLVPAVSWLVSILHQFRHAPSMYESFCGLCSLESLPVRCSLLFAWALLLLLPGRHRLPSDHRGVCVFASNVVLKMSQSFPAYPCLSLHRIISPAPGSEFRRSSTPSILEPNLHIMICTNSPMLRSWSEVPYFKHSCL